MSSAARILKQTLAVPVLCALALASGACSPLGGRGDDAAADDGSVLASLQGMNPGDATFASVTYTLICEAPQAAAGAAQPAGYPKTIAASQAPSPGDAQVSFPAHGSPAIAVGDLCHIEIRTSDATALATWTWKGIKAGKTVDAGLMYSSDAVAVPATYALSLKLFILYSKPGPASPPLVVPPTTSGPSTPPVLSPVLSTPPSLGTACVTPQGGGCVDVKLPWSSTYLLAKVLAAMPGQAPSAYWVAATDAGGSSFQPFSGTDLTVSDLNSALQGVNGAPVLGAPTLAWYSAGLESNLPAVLQLPFDATFQTGASLATYRLTGSSLAGLSVSQIVAVWVHGFHQVTPEALNAQTSPAWLADVVASNPGGPAQEFFVSGDLKYFGSSGKYGTSPSGAPSWFDVASFRSQLQGGAQHWTVYAFAGGAFASSGCSAGKDYYLASLSARLPNPGLPTAGIPDNNLDACVVSGIAAAALGSSMQATLSSWEWFTLGQ